MLQRARRHSCITCWLLVSQMCCLGVSAAPVLRIDRDDIGGYVRGAHGPEAGVWVIAETLDLPTKFSRVVVTDDEGRYLIPNLPSATYDVWVRGYGLVDSAKVKVVPGKYLNLKAIAAPNARAAAQYYPANYWYAMLKIPSKSDFPGTGTPGNGISPLMTRQEQWIDHFKTSFCEPCHQLGNRATREFPEAFRSADMIESWRRRLAGGQAGAIMSALAAAPGQDRALQLLADWTERIQQGELPFDVPKRPQGIERNLVITNWDYGEAQEYVHDAVSTDKRNPAVNSNGPVYGATEASSDKLVVLDPDKNTAYELAQPLRDPATPYAWPHTVLSPSAYWGDGIIWNGKANAHSCMFDGQGRLWCAATIRGRDNPSYCREGSDHPSAKLFPLDSNVREVNMYDPRSKKFTLIDTCFSTLHLMFASDDTLMFGSETGEVFGWLNTRLYDQTHDERRAQNWTALILDTNGNGKRDENYQEFAPKLDPTRDTRIRARFYSVIENPVDHSIWGSVNAFPGFIVRLDLGTNPPSTALAEVYAPPFDNPRASIQGYTPRGIDVDRNGVIWTNLTGSGHLASFDRRKCKGPLNGPSATGQQCPEGWTLYPLPGPQFKGVTENGSATASYLVWVDQFNVFGLGKNVPFITGNGADALYALLPSGKFVTLRVPYPMVFYSKGLDGRIDNPRAGWEGRGLWASDGSRVPWHAEGGRGERPKLHKFQLRPDPLAH